jgi:glycosyltransferase involved in cell wall biosynthesis
MKIALYVPSWPPGSSPNGIVTYAAQIVPALRRLGHEVFVLTPNHTERIADAYTIDLNAIHVPRSIWSWVKSQFFPKDPAFNAFVEKLQSAILTLTTRHNLDVMEIEESFGWSWRITQAEIIPVVVRLHGPWFLNGNFDDPLESKYRKRIDLEGRAISAAALVTAPSVDVLKNVRTYYDLKLDLARVIPNPIEVGSNATAWQLSDCNPNRILYVGRFDRRKGGDIVLRAFAILAELYPDLRLSFVGPDNGIHEDGNRLSFEQFVRKNLPASCWSRIDFRGQLTQENVMALRTEHFFTIIASQFEILPYSVLEAMSLGCPIIASNVGGIPELITDQKNGLLFESQNVAELTSICRKLLDDHTLASSLGSQARKDCIALFNVQQIAMETVSAYQAAIEAFARNLRFRG